MTPESLRNVFDKDHGSGTESAFVDGSSIDGSEAIRIDRGGTDARSAAADRYADGQLHDRIRGRASAKGAIELRAATLFIERLNRAGGNWNLPILVNADAKHEAGIDATAGTNDGDILSMQVTTVEREAWAQLAHVPEVARLSGKTSRAVEALRCSIADKSNIDGRDKIVLLIDASDSPAASLRSVVADFRREFGAWAQQQGYAAIWVTGPVIDLVNRLDVC